MIEKDKNLNKIFQDIEDDLDYGLSIEEDVMKSIQTEKDHSEIIARYKRWVALGIRVSIGLMMVLFVFMVLPIFNNVQQQDFEFEVILPTLFSLIGLCLMYIQVTLRTKLK